MFEFDNTYVRDLPGFYAEVTPDSAPSPEVLEFNQELAEELGAEEGLRERIARIVGGKEVPEGAQPIAQVYAGHQFGHFSGRLGDGRALLLGEVIDRDGRRRDIHLKGSGATPFSRGGDGKAVVGPVLREYLMGEAMHALGVPTTRALAAVATGEMVLRDEPLDGAVLARVASSHLRVGTFEYFAATGERDKLCQLVGYAIARHLPDARKLCEASDDEKALALLRHVVCVQAELIAKWMSVGFIHGVMNTDNMTISGETIDYGPCAFMDTYDPKTVFSSIDRRGRYAYGNQPGIAQWNLLRLAVALAPLLADDNEALQAQVEPILSAFPGLYESAHLRIMRQKLGLEGEETNDASLIEDYLSHLEARKLDYTMSFRALAVVLRNGGDQAPLDLEAWWPRYLERLGDAHREQIAVNMDAVNPIYIPRNHKVEEALESARRGDLGVFERLLELLKQPFEERAGAEAFAEPAPESFYPYQTFCGT